MKLQQAAEQIDTAPNTLRLWCTIFTDFLSPVGAVENGQCRDFTADDLKVIYAIKRAKDSGYTVEAIKELLTEAKAKGYRRLQSPPQLLTGHTTLEPHSNTDTQMHHMARELENGRRQIQELRAQVDAQSAHILEIERQNAAMANELKLWRAGRLKANF